MDVQTIAMCSRPGGGENGEGLPGGDEPLAAHVQDDLLPPGLEAGHGETGLWTMGALYIRVDNVTFVPTDLLGEIYKVSCISVEMMSLNPGVITLNSIEVR